jgi:uncharacterized protein (TIGR02145 family)
MRKLSCLVALLNAYYILGQNFGSFYDPRDGETYKTIQIGNQIWMAENLAYSPSNGNYFSYNNDPSSVSKYGYLYDWATACKVCPSGWKLPSNNDFLELTNYIGSDFKSKMMLKTAWPVDENASNNFGFSGLPAGMRDHTGAFRYLGTGGYFWTSTFSHQSFAFAREIGKNAGNWASHEFGTNQYIGMSVRCLKDLSDDSGEIETLDDEYVESDYQEPQKMSYKDDHPIKKGVTQYSVFKTQTCNESQDFYYNYTGEYKCEPQKIESYKITIDIHLADPMYDEAKVKMVNLKTKEVTDFDIEYVEEMEDGSLSFVFSVINQPHQFILNKNNKTITWYSEWGHWKVSYFYK